MRDVLPRVFLPRIVLALVLGAIAGPAGAQPIFTSAFPPEEFAARRTRRDGRDRRGVAVLQGATETASYLAVPAEQPVLLPDRRRGAARDPADRRRRRSVDAVPAAARRAEGAIGRADARARRDAVRLTGIEAVVPRDEFAAALDAVPRERAPSTCRSAGESLGGASVARPAGAMGGSRPPIPGTAAARARRCSSRRIKARARRGSTSRISIRILDALRFVKSPREIALDPRVDAHRRPGDDGSDAIGAARHVRVRDRGDRGLHLQASTTRRAPAYFALVAAGKNSALSALPRRRSRETKDGDLVLFDYAPDYNYTLGRDAHVPGNGQFTP